MMNDVVSFSSSSVVFGGQLPLNFADMQVVNRIMYSCSSDHTARAWLKDVGEPLQVYKGNDMPISRVVYHKGVGRCCMSPHWIIAKMQAYIRSQDQ